MFSQASICPQGGVHPPGQTPPPRDGQCRGRCASYWNAFLGEVVFNCSKLVLTLDFYLSGYPYGAYSRLLATYHEQKMYNTLRNKLPTKMDSNRMCTTRRSSRHGGGGSPHPLARYHSNSPLGVGLDQIPLNFPLGCGPGPDPPQLPPWVWAWARSPSTSLGVGLKTPHSPGRRSRPPRDQRPPPFRSRQPSPVNRILDTRL